MESSDVIILLILLGCMATYIPVFMCLFFTAVLGFLLFTDLPLLLLFQTIFRSMDNFALVVVLFFILCGNVMTAGSIVEKLIKVANSLVSSLPGGLGMAGVLACGLFGAISGSTVATVVALGGFMIPALLENGYPEKYTLGLMTTSPNLGVIIPPSIGMILYSMISNVSLEGLFLTGFVPGEQIEASSQPQEWAAKIETVARMLARIHATPYDDAVQPVLMNANVEAVWFLKNDTIPPYIDQGGSCTQINANIIGKSA